MSEMVNNNSSPSPESSPFVSPSSPTPHNFHLSNNFTEWPTYFYPDYHWLYCTNGHWIPGERNLIIGSIYIAEYIFYLALYFPTLLVISSPVLLRHSCYKLMLAIGLMDIYNGFYVCFFAGLFSILGTNYCDNTMFLIVVGHLQHATWFMYCATGVLLGLNRYIDIKWPEIGQLLFEGRRTWYWLTLPVVYGLIGASSIDLPPIYNSVWSTFLFQIDLRPGAPPVTNWYCVTNSVCVLVALVTIYSLLLVELRRAACVVVSSSSGVPAVQKSVSARQRKVAFQSFLICFFIALVAVIFGLAGFVSVPLPAVKLTTIALQLCSGFTPVVYLVFNRTIREGVQEKMSLHRISNHIARSNVDRARKSEKTGDDKEGGAMGPGDAERVQAWAQPKTC